jgi:outer membrane receptor for ferrienterochelin and colicins
LVATTLLCTLQIAKAQQSLFVQIGTTDSNNSSIDQASLTSFCGTSTTQLQSNLFGWIQLLPTDQNCKYSIVAAGYDTKYNVQLKKDTNYIYLERKNTLLQDIVVTGQAKNIIAEKSIYKINVLNTNTLKNIAANNVAEALSTQSNFFLQQDNVLGSTMNMQGIGGQNIKILLNGIPVNGRENGNVDLGQMNLANVDRIEIVKGPMSVLYGTDALGGVINIISKTMSQGKKVELFSYNESIGKFNQHLVGGLSKKRHSMQVTLGRNFFIGAIANDTFSRSMLWKPKQQYTADANYTFSTSKGRLIYMPSFMTEKIVNLGAPSVDAFGAYSADEYYTTTRMANTILADWEIDSNHKATMSNSISIYNRKKSRYAKDLIAGTEQQTSGRGDQDTSTYIDYNFRGFYNSKFSDKASVMLGYEVAVQKANSGKLAAHKKTLADVAAYVTIPIAFTKKISVQPALRIANNSFYKVPITPSIHLRWAVGKQIVFRASYARGFRAPSLKELYLTFVDVNHNVSGNTDLLPEKSHQLQMHLDAPFITNSQTKLSMGNSFYINSIRNQIVLAASNAGSNSFTYANVDAFTNISLENNVQYTYKKYRSSYGITINHIASADSNRGFTNIELISTQSKPLPFWGLVANANYRFISKQALLTLGALGKNASYTSYLPPMHFADVNVSKNFAKQNLTLQLGVKNIFGIRQTSILGNANNSVHGSNGVQNISIGRSGFVSVLIRK